MSIRDGLGCLEKRDLLNRSAASMDALLRWGRQFEEADLIYDAIDFYEKANAREDLTRFLDAAREEGNAFLYKRLCRATGRDPIPEEWLSLAERAERLGKYAFAAQAYRLAGNEEMAQQCQAREELHAGA